LPTSIFHAIQSMPAFYREADIGVRAIQRRGHNRPHRWHPAAATVA
jgi:hypothetical protein